MIIVYMILVLLFAGVVTWAAKTILNAPGLIVADPWRTIIWVLVILAVFCFVVQAFFGPLSGWPSLRVWR